MDILQLRTPVCLVARDVLTARVINNASHVHKVIHLLGGNVLEGVLKVSIWL